MERTKTVDGVWRPWTESGDRGRILETVDGACGRVRSIGAQFRPNIQTSSKGKRHLNKKFKNYGIFVIFFGGELIPLSVTSESHKN